MAKVLVVNDDAGICAAVRRTLARIGHEVWDVPGPPASPLTGRPRGRPGRAP